MEPLHRLPAAPHEDMHPPQLPQFPHVRRARVPEKTLQEETQETDLLPRAPPEHGKPEPLELKQGKKPAPFQSTSYLKKQAPSEIWSRWTKWSDCSPDCRTYRVRRCKKPGRCKKQVQTQAAYCYHEGTECEEWVLKQVEAKQRSNWLGKQWGDWGKKAEQNIILAKLPLFAHEA